MDREKDELGGVPPLLSCPVTVTGNWQKDMSRKKGMKGANFFKAIGFNDVLPVTGSPASL